MFVKLKGHEDMTTGNRKVKEVMIRPVIYIQDKS